MITLPYAVECLSCTEYTSLPYHCEEGDILYITCEECGSRFRHVVGNGRDDHPASFQKDTLDDE